MAKDREQELADELFKGQQQKPMGTAESVREAFQALAPGLSWDKFVGDIAHELTEKTSQGAHEFAAALFNGSGFVMYPRGTREDQGKEGHGVHGPEQEQDGQSFVDKLQQEGPEQGQERGGREM